MPALGAGAGAVAQPASNAMTPTAVIILMEHLRVASLVERSVSAQHIQTGCQAPAERICGAGAAGTPGCKTCMGKYFQCCRRRYPSRTVEEYSRDLSPAARPVDISRSCIRDGRSDR